MDSYVDAVERGFGCDLDYGRIVKHYETEPVGPGRCTAPTTSSWVNRSR